MEHCHEIMTFSSNIPSHLGSAPRFSALTHLFSASDGRTSLRLRLQLPTPFLLHLSNDLRNRLRQFELSGRARARERGSELPLLLGQENRARELEGPGAHVLVRAQELLGACQDRAHFVAPPGGAAAAQKVAELRNAGVGFGDGLRRRGKPNCYWNVDASNRASLKLLYRCIDENVVGTR